MQDDATSAGIRRETMVWTTSETLGREQLHQPERNGQQ